MKLNIPCTFIAVPDGLFSVNYTLFENDVPVATFYRKLISAQLKGSITTKGVTRQVYRTGWFSSTFIMESVTGLGEAIAKRNGWFSASFTIDYLGNTITLKKKYWSFKERYLLMQDEQQVGVIYQPKMFSRELAMDISVDLPLEIIAFILWLTIVLISASNDDSSSSQQTGM